MSDTCDYRMLTTRFKNTLGLPEDMFDSMFDYCFCRVCYSARGDREHYTRGNQVYVLPLDFRRFGLLVTPPPEDEDVFNNWHVAYHGTDFESIESIWRVGLRIPVLSVADPMFESKDEKGRFSKLLERLGDFKKRKFTRDAFVNIRQGEHDSNGKEIVEKVGHFNDRTRPDGFDTKKIFVSPSPRYSGSDVYATSKLYEDRKTKMTYSCTCIFQLRIKPGTYDSTPTTVKKLRNIDPHVDDKVIEWSTKSANCIILTGLLFKLTPKQSSTPTKSVPTISMSSTSSTLTRKETDASCNIS